MRSLSEFADLVQEILEDQAEEVGADDDWRYQLYMDMPDGTVSALFFDTPAGERGKAKLANRLWELTTSLPCVQAAFVSPVWVAVGEDSEGRQPSERPDRYEQLSIQCVWLRDETRLLRQGTVSRGGDHPAVSGWSEFGTGEGETLEGRFFDALGQAFELKRRLATDPIGLLREMLAQAEADGRDAETVERLQYAIRLGEQHPEMVAGMPTARWLRGEQLGKNIGGDRFDD